MDPGFAIELPGLRCPPAQTAAVVRHDYLQNWILNCRDNSIIARFQHAESVAMLEAAVRALAGDLRGFSGPTLVAAVPPLASLSATDRARIEARVADAFERAYAPDARAARILALLDDLLHAGRDAVAAELGAAQAEALGWVRSAASALHTFIGELPRGFWLPTSQVSGH